jgi:hypothetical protein
MFSEVRAVDLFPVARVVVPEQTDVQFLADKPGQEHRQAVITLAGLSGGDPEAEIPAKTVPGNGAWGIEAPSIAIGIAVPVALRDFTSFCPPARPVSTRASSSNMVDSAGRQ